MILYLMTPSYFVIFFRDNFLQISSCLEIILGYFEFTKFRVLEFLELISPSLVCLNFSGFVRILFSCVLDRVEFAVLVNFFKTWLEVAEPVSVFILFSHGSRAISFLVLFGLFRFFGT